MLVLLKSVEHIKKAKRDMSKKRFIIERVRFNLVWNGFHPDPTRKDQLVESSRKPLMRKRPGEYGDGCMAVVTFKTKQAAIDYLDTEVTAKETEQYNIVKLKKLRLTQSTMDW